MTNSGRSGVGVVIVALVVLSNCGGQTTRSGDDLEVAADSAGNGGSETGGAADDGSSDGSADDRSSGETVVSAVSAQAVTSTSSGGDGGASGYGGTGSFGVAGVGAFAGMGGGESSAVITNGGVIGTGGTGIDWGDVPVPDGCQMTGRHLTYSDSCELVTYCNERLVSSWCSFDGTDYGCACSGSSDWSSWSGFKVYGVGAKAACLYALNACLRSDAFEVGPVYCDITSEQYYAEGCRSFRECSRIASVGDVKLSEFKASDVSCRMTMSGFICECPDTLGYVRFEGSESASMALCTDAQDWCGGDAVELSGERSCSATSELSVSDFCTTQLECQRDVLVSGMEATMFDQAAVQCYTRDDGMYDCECPLLSLFYVEAPDLDSACTTAAALCAAEP